MATTVARVRALGDGGRTDEAISDSIHANGRVGPTTDAVVRPAHPSSAVHAHPCHSRSSARPAVCRRSVGRPVGTDDGVAT
ncbi:hypothetical protein CP556_12500 [Natrinema sp. CBA1119]|uniref:hypothetical protein n=1 Tax=Natrinema sp. CBA1119 TaxID=1608465 RepID=UPI000BF8B8BE|nr:hypothetical protein [Natrinema sp. CBA1119]PGF16857.1 hypothetical protein CP556_12500 [Natrinema sp. CBA1119]